jgi:hypothetical protein
MKTYKQFKEAALAIPVASKLVIPALGGIIKGVKAITNRETGLSDSERERLNDLMKKVDRAKKNRKTQQTEKDILDYGREKEGIAERPRKKVEEENKHRDAKLLYQYKQLQDPKRPSDPIKALKLKKA